MGLLSNAISGLQASQVALRTTGHNISNANTEGYSRQQVDYGTRPPQPTGVGFLGSGVNVQAIERVVNQFMIAQLRTDTTNYNEMQKFNEQIGNIDKLLADSGTGLGEGLQKFFSALQSGADDPASTPARQLIISEAESLTSRFNLLYGRLDSLNSSIRSESRVVVSQINSLAKSIASLNITIQKQQQLGENSPPNDLLDEREQQLKKLSELVSVQVIEQDGGDINVMIGAGQPLVVGQAVSRLEITADDKILLTNSARSIEISDTINGGKLGGLLTFRDEVLNPTFNELGRVALVLAKEFNDIQEQGLDLDGDYGSSFFTDINDPIVMASRVLGDADNTPPNDRNITVEIANTAELTIDDYNLRIVPNTLNYIVTRKSDGAEITQGILPGAYPTSIEFDGLVVNFNSGSFQGGDEFTISPTRRGAIDIESLLDRPQDIAFAVPIRTLTGEGNSGAGVIDAGRVISLVDTIGNTLPAFSQPGQLSPPVIVVFTSPTTYDVLDNSDPANPVHLDPPIRNKSFVANQNNYIFNEDPGATLVAGNGFSMGLPAGRNASTQVSGGPALANGYPVEQLTFTTTNPVTGATSVQNVTTNFNANARATATMLSNLQGVTANAFTEASITDLNITNFTTPLQLRLNGQDLIGYSLGNISPEIPNPATDEIGFNDYLAEQINSNPALLAQGIYATSTTDPATGNPELQILSSTGVNLDIRLEGVAGDNLSVNDGVNPDVRLTAAGAGQESMVTVGGRIDLTLAADVELTTAPSVSQFFGDSADPDFAQDAFLGYQIMIKGAPDTGDRFTVEFNSDASSDNRNALRFVELETREVVEHGSLSLSEGYGQLVERVGTTSNLAKINMEASLALLRETQENRDAVSGVNLDEEAANLIKFEQGYNANARVISIARDIFDTLLNSF